MRRLVDAAKAHGLDDKLRKALERTPIASVGPVVSEELTAFGFRTGIYPDNNAFFMRPLIVAMAAALGRTPPRTKAG